MSSHKIWRESPTVIAYENVGDIEFDFLQNFGVWSVIKNQKEFKG
jgi:hypothetical protein